MLATTTGPELTGHWTKMRRSLARFSGPVSLIHAPSLADSINTTPEFRFSVHTGTFEPCARSIMAGGSASLVIKESGHARTVERLAADRAGAQDQTDQIGHAFLPARPRGAGPRHRRILCRCRRALCRRRNFPNRSLPGRRHRVVSLDRD